MMISEAHIPQQRDDTSLFNQRYQFCWRSQVFFNEEGCVSNYRTFFEKFLITKKMFNFLHQHHEWMNYFFVASVFF